MELALSLGDASKPFNPSGGGLEFGVGLGFNSGGSPGKEVEDDAPPSLQLDLLPFSPVPRSTPPDSQFRLAWLSPASIDDMDDGGAQSSPNSAVSSFQMEFGISGRSKRDMEENDGDKDVSRGGSDDDENRSTRKKLRLSKEQSAFLEESFKEHSTLIPKQKLELAKQLNLRPRQVEVWFQNRRARTKLKQTEIDCEYLKRRCETLTEENRRLQKELQILKTSPSPPFLMQIPATTLTMCPSCERVSTTASSVSAASVCASGTASPALGKARSFPFSGKMEAHKAAS